MYKNLITAIRTLTIIRVPGKDTENFASSLPWFPLVGFMLSGMLYGISFAASSIIWKEWPECVAFLVVAFSILLTGALHLDGLADWADALGCSHDRKRMLAVMKDSRSGAFGVIALIVILLGKWIALTKLSALGMMEGPIGAYIVSRFAIVDLAVWLPYARSEGGTGEYLVKHANRKHRVWAFIISIVLLFAFLGPAGVVLLFTGWIIGRIYGLWCRRKLGGITGDLLGACSEIVEMSLLFAGAAYGVIGL